VGTAIPPASADRSGGERPESPERRTQPARTGLGQWFSRRIRPGEPETAAATGAGERDGAPNDVTAPDASVDDSVWSRREDQDEPDGTAYGEIVLREPSLDDLLGDAGARVRGAVGRGQPTTAVYSSQYASSERMRIAGDDTGDDRDTHENQGSLDNAYGTRGDQRPHDDRVHDGRNSRDAGGRDSGSSREGSGAPRSATHRDRPSRRQQARRSADGRTMPADGGSTGGAGGFSGGGGVGGGGGGGGGDGT
jgi:hypothetical protein